jgi:hypothetical protein
MAETFFCSKCGKTMDENNFYTYKDGRKTEMCKKCLTMHIDNFNESTFLWLLEKMDVPYVPEEWNVLRDRAYAKDPAKMNGMSVFGKYLSKMKLKQWKNYTWADTEKLQAQNKEKQAAAAAEREQHEQELKEQLENGEISEAQYKTLVSTETQNKDYLEDGPNPAFIGADNPFNEDEFISEDELGNPAAELTQEDKIYLAMKWGRTYKPAEWVELERMYTEMTNSFDIQDADTMNTLILLCKTTLKMNQAIDCGDVDGFQKLSRVSDSLRKSAKFTAAQNKEEKNDYVDSIGELVNLCEKEGFIPRYATDIPQDKVDLTLQDMQKYVYKLVTQDLGFGQQIEDSLKKIQIQKEMNAAEEKKEITDDTYDEIEDQDFEEFYEEVSNQQEQDQDIFEGE